MRKSLLFLNQSQNLNPIYCIQMKKNQASEKPNAEQSSSEPSKQPQVVADAFSALNNREKFL